MTTVNIIILNWNGWKDTIECLSSLFINTYSDYKIILVDNGSSDESCIKIDEFLFQSPKEYSNKVIFIKNTTNLGFAGGCNLGMDYLSNNKLSSLVLLLNNDTIVTKDFLTKLIECYSTKEYQAISPQIRYYFDKEKLWYCGGRIRKGIKKYYYRGKDISELPKKNIIKSSLITGCALLFDYEQLGKLTDKFFYGEEDFEFSLRNSQKGFKMCVYLPSIIYHKVGQSTKKRGSKLLASLHIEYLNRLINYKNYSNKIYYYYLWRPYMILSLSRYISKTEKISLHKKRIFIKNIISDSEKNSQVDQKTYNEILRKYE